MLNVRSQTESTTHHYKSNRHDQSADSHSAQTNKMQSSPSGSLHQEELVVKEKMEDE